MSKKFGFLLLACGSLAGCASFTPAQVADPTGLTIERAMTDVGAGFAGMNAALRRDGHRVKTGLYPCKVVVTLNVTANAERGGGLLLDANAAAPAVKTETASTATADAKLHVEQKNSSTAVRGNTVNIEMYSIPCLPTDTLAGSAPDKVSTVVKAATDGVDFAPYSLKGFKLPE
ncbi:hypothetical protein [Hansschlegelia sp. KR7-227]|uniref:hypothetical protein n=1 Tax=Hansschlegelia sp. KR7-227 TaxID=3400914 RepID=UPI003C1079A5